MTKNLNAEQITQTHNIADINTSSIGVRSRGQRRAVSTLNGQPSLTKQADRDRANIHKILKRGEKTGIFPVRTAVPLDENRIIPTVESFHEAMNIITGAEAAFHALPVKIRERFKHDPAQLLNFIADDNNRSEAYALGLVNTPPQGVAAEGGAVAGGSISEPTASPQPVTTT